MSGPPVSAQAPRLARGLAALLLWHLAAAEAPAQPAAHVPGPVAPAVVASPAADTTRRASLVVAADTARRPPAALPAAEPTDQVTRRSALRIGAAIVALTLSTLLLYNVRSR